MSETRREKRNRVLKALEHPELGKLSSRQLATHLNLNRTFIDRVRNLNSASGSKNGLSQRVRSDGLTFTPRACKKKKAPGYPSIVRRVLKKFCLQNGYKFESVDQLTKEGILTMDTWLELVELARHEFYGVTGQVSEASRKNKSVLQDLLEERVRHQVRRSVLKEAMKKSP